MHRPPKDRIAPSVPITRASLDDADAIFRCVRAAFEPYRAQYTEGAYEDTVMTPATVRERIETMIVLVARSEDGKIVGTIGGVARGAEGHIRGMAVEPSWQGHGIAARLLAAVERELAAAGCSYATLDTTAPLARGRRFYERNGYVRTEGASDFFGMPLQGYQKQLSFT